MPKHFEEQQGRLVELVTLLVAGREEVPCREEKTPACFLSLKKIGPACVLLGARDGPHGAVSMCPGQELPARNRPVVSHCSRQPASPVHRVGCR